MRLSFLFIVLSLVVFSCKKKEKEQSEFSYSFENEITIPAGSATNSPINRFTGDNISNSESKFLDNDTRKNLIQSIRANDVGLVLVSPNTETLGFVASISVYIDSEGEPETLFASFENIPEESGRSIDLEIANSDFQAYLKKEKFAYRVNVVTRQTNTQDVVLRLNSNFDAKASIYRE